MISREVLLKSKHTDSARLDACFTSGSKTWKAEQNDHTETQLSDEPKFELLK